jgi:outer membrane protein TolC
MERELTLEDALAQARKRNRTLIADRERLAQAQTNLSQAWANLLPTIAAQGRYTRNYAEFSFPVGPNEFLRVQPLNQLDAIISFTQPLIVPAAYPALTSVKKGIGAAEANFDTSETAILFAVAQAFHSAGISDEVARTRRSSIEVARATLANAKTRFAAGTVTKVDVDRAEIAVLRAEQAERDALHARGQAYRALGTLAQIEGPFQVKIANAPASSPASDATLENALQLRPEIRALQLQFESADSRKRAEGWRWSPSLSAFGNARRFNYQNFRRDNYSWAVGIQLDWVIFDGGVRDANRRRAAAEAAEAHARADALRDTIRDDLANNQSLLETKQQAMTTAARSVELARETLGLVRTQYEAGTVTQVDLLQAQDVLVGAELALAQARFDVAIADLTLRRAAGTFPPR